MPQPVNVPEILEDEINEIFTMVPGWTSRWGITFIFAFFVLFLIMSWFIKYPDIIRAKVIITTSPPPVIVTTRASGTLRLLKEENSELTKNEIFAFLTSSASYQDVIALEASLQRDETLDELQALQLGDLQPFYNQYRAATQEGRLLEQTGAVAKQISALEHERRLNENLRQNLNEELKILREELVLSNERFLRDSVLFLTSVISAHDYNLAKTSHIQFKYKYRNATSMLTNNEIRVGMLTSQITERKAQMQEQSQRASLTVLNARNALQAQIAKWKESFLFISPSSGKLSFLKFLENDLFISQGEAIFSVVPRKIAVYAQCEIPVSGSGKIKPGQLVNIKLENYPFHEYGILEGRLIHISEVPSGKNYLGKIAINSDLETTYNKKLTFRPQLQGDTEIITDEKSILERIFFQLRALLVVA